MASDYSRFYLVGGRLAGFKLYCLDCDEEDLVPFDDGDADPLDLGQMVRAADRHVAERHPVQAIMGQVLTVADPEPPLGSVVVDDCGLTWENDGYRPCCWVRPDLREQGIHDPETWRKIAGNYGPVTVQQWGPS